MVKQGDIIKLADPNCLALVISKDSYNETGHVIACPVIKNKPDATLSLEIKDGSYALCDNLRRLDLNTRSYHVAYNISMSKMIYVVDMVQSMFDYF